MMPIRTSAVWFMYTYTVTECVQRALNSHHSHTSSAGYGWSVITSDCAHTYCRPVWYSCTPCVCRVCSLMWVLSVRMMPIHTAGRIYTHSPRVSLHAYMYRCNTTCVSLYVQTGVHVSEHCIRDTQMNACRVSYRGVYTCTCTCTCRHPGTPPWTEY